MTERNVIIIEESAIESKLYATQRISSLNKRLILVSWNKHESKLLYTIFSTDHTADVADWEKSIPNNIDEKIALRYWNDLNHIFRDIIPTGNPSEERWENIRLALEGIGQSLFNELVPLELAECIRLWEPGLSISFSTAEEWIPWELMFDGENFLGDKFIIVRLPRLRKSIRNRVTALKVDNSILHGLKKVSRIVNVVGGNIRPHTATQRALVLFDSLENSIHIERINEQSLAVFKSALVDADILHFTCHGHHHPFHLLQNFSDVIPESNNLCIHTVQRLALKHGSFVFANACTSSTPFQAFSEFTSFGLEFYLQGVDIFIGTLGIIPTEYAISFAENVYRELLQSNIKITVGQAVANAKKMSKANKNNFFWLLYCIYGDPDYCFEPIDHSKN
jgi:CHAT domain